jgi:ArsR family transcriptional regulator
MKKPTPEELRLLHIELCSAINDPTRIAILYELAESSCYVSSLVTALGLPQGTVSRHLKVLRERGIVAATREANRVRYALEDHRVIEVLDTLRGILGDYLRRQQMAADRIRRERSAPRPGQRKAAARSGAREGRR